MCGIAGFAGAGDRADLRAMTDALVHRGPDGSGEHVDESLRVFLGHRRLAILDIEGGAQPMWNEDRTVCIVFNGEIYNHAALREALTAKGHRFASDHSDTETLVHGYEEWGSDLPSRLNGMFAFAVLDTVRRLVFLARDRFGEKPLFYCHRPGFFAFASELTALGRHPGIDRELDPRSLQKFFAYGYLPAPNALFRGSRKLPGGHSATFDLRRGELTLRCYWRFRLEPDHGLGDDREPDLIEELRGLIVEAVRRRLMSDVPLGLFLSGGLDSSMVLAAMARHLPPDRINSFTIGFDEPSFDETPSARALAAYFGTDHREKVLRLQDAMALIPRSLASMDEPLGDASLLPTHLLCAFTRRHVTVALSGDGGDELFAGYDPFDALGPAALYHRIVPQRLHRGLRCLAELLPISPANMSLDFKLRRALTGLSYPPEMWHPAWMAAVEPEALVDLFHAPLRAEEVYEEAIDLWRSGRDLDTVDRGLEFFTNLYLPDDILVKSDRSAMHASLEARAVFLDNDLVEFCRRLPNRFKYRRGERKYLLRRSLSGMVPDAVLRRPKKGFGIPLASWLRGMKPPDNVTVPGIDETAVARAWAAHRDAKADHRLLLFSWLGLQSCLAGARG